MRKAAEELRRQRTLVLIKPDAVRRGLVGEILKRFERAGLKIVGLKFLTPTRSQLKRHFPTSKEWITGIGQKTSEFFHKHELNPIDVFDTADPYRIGMKINNWNYSYLLLGPVAAVVIEGAHAIAIVRKMIGNTIPYYALPGTIRGDFSINSPDLTGYFKCTCQNLIHAADSKETAEREISCWFRSEELVSWERPDESLLLLSSEKEKPTKKTKRERKKKWKKRQL